MALQSFTISIGTLVDADSDGKNYVSGQPIYIKKTNGVLQPIYRDLAGSSEIQQDGLANVTASNGQFTFFIEAGGYNAEYQNQVTPITVVGADYFNSRVDESVQEIMERTPYVVGNFADGFTYDAYGQVGIDASGNVWAYIGAGAPNKVVTAGTVPSEPDYKQVTFSDHSNLSNRNAVGAHDDIYSRIGNEADQIAINYNVGANATIEKVSRNFNYRVISSGALGDGDIIIDKANGDRFELQIEGALDLKAFERSGRTDQEAMQRALDYASNKSGHWVVALTPRINEPYWMFSNLSVGDRTILQNHGGKLKFMDNIATDTGSQYFPINAQGEEIWLDGLHIDGNRAGGNDQFVVCDTVTIGGDGNKITDLLILDAPDSALMFSDNKNSQIDGLRIFGAGDVGIYANGSAAGSTYNNQISNIVATGCRFGAIGFKRSFTDCQVSNVSARICGNGLTFEDFGSDLYPKRLDISGVKLNDIGYNQRGVGVAERGISFSKGDDISISDVSGTNISGNILNVESADRCTFEGFSMKGYTASPNPTSGNNGLRVFSSSDTNYLNLNFRGVANDAGYLENVTGGALVGGNYESATGTGLRVNATCSLDEFSPTKLGGGVADLQWFNGATGLSNGYTLANETGVKKRGVRSLNAATPVGLLTPRWETEKVFMANDNSWWMAYGLTNSDWSKISN
tara:strand:- start:2666 stop:4723 length:2058 start_codon:yes stop_codon:yes gene_type:complete